MANIITNQTLTPEQQLAARIDAQIKRAAQAQKQAYDNIRRLLYGDSPDADTLNARYAAFQANTATGLTAGQLGQMARLAKASLNLFQPGAVVDDVPEATISF